MSGRESKQRLRPFVEAEFKRARTEGRRESYEAYALDALTHLCEGASTTSDQASARPTTRAVRNLALLRVDFAALRRGHTGEGELCEIAGLGPVPVHIARDMLGESIAKLVITDGVAVRNVTHLGRGPTVAQRMALLFEQPLCSAEGCYRTRTEIDHTDTWADTHCTRLGCLDPLCKYHHDLKTYAGWMLTPGTGKRPMVPPDDPRHPNFEPPP